MARHKRPGPGPAFAGFDAVLFDLDNTLVDFVEWKTACTNAAIRAMMEAGLRGRFGLLKKRMLALYDEAGWENQRVFDLFLRQVQGKVDERVLACGVAAYRKTKAAAMKPYPMTVETLLELHRRGLKLGIVSDAPRRQAWLRLAELNLVPFFDVVVALDDTGRKKPDGAPFAKAIERLGVPAEKILFVGDIPDCDILGASRAGMRTALAAYGQFRKGESPSDFTLTRISDLVRVIDRAKKGVLATGKKNPAGSAGRGGKRR